MHGDKGLYSRDKLSKTDVLMNGISANGSYTVARILSFVTPIHTKG